MHIQIVDLTSLTQFFNLSAAELAQVQSLSISGVGLNQPLDKIQDLADVQQQMYITDSPELVFTIELHPRDHLNNQNMQLENLFSMFSYTLMKCPALIEINLDSCQLGNIPAALEMLADDLNKYCLQLHSLAIQNDDFSHPQAGIASAEEYFSRLPITHLSVSQTRLFRTIGIDDDDEDLQEFCEHSRTLILTLLSPENLTRLDVNTQEVADTLRALASKKIRCIAGHMAPSETMGSLEYGESAWQELDLASQVRWLIQKLQCLQQDYSAETLMAFRLKYKQASSLFSIPVPSIDQNLSCHSFPLYNLNYKPMPQIQGYDANGVEHVFDMERIAGDGHCGFTALKVSRDDMADFLNRYVGQANVIARFKSVLLEYLILQKHPLLVAVHEQAEALRELFANLPENIFEEIKGTGARLQWLRDNDQAFIAEFAEQVLSVKQAAELELDTYLASDHLFSHYCEQLRHQLWLDTESIRLYAEARGFSVYVWQPRTESNAIYLNPAHSYFATDDAKTIHLLYDGRHFDRLAPSKTPFLASDLSQLPSTLSEGWQMDMSLFN